MRLNLKTVAVLLAGVVSLFASGCAGLDRMGAKLDMASEHLSAPKPLYEGRLKSVKTIGAMTSLQFSDGKIFEARNAPAGLRPGDIVRLYSETDGYSAHLWHDVESLPPSAESEALAPHMNSAN